MTTLALLIRHRMRRDRIQIPIWLASIATLVLFAGLGLQETFGSLEERTLLIRLAAANPSILFLRGTPQGTDVDAVLIFTILAFVGVLVGLMNTFLAVRHLRAEEESGRADLVSSTPAARVFPPLATLVYGLLVNAALAITVTGSLLIAGQAVAGSIVTGVALAAVGVVFLTVGGVASELMPSGRAANGVAVGAVLVAYLLRGIADAFGTVSADGLTVQSAWPSWLSPIGWAQQTHPFTGNNPAPLALHLAAAAGALRVCAAGHVAQGHRGERAGEQYRESDGQPGTLRTGRSGLAPPVALDHRAGARAGQRLGYSRGRWGSRSPPPTSATTRSPTSSPNSPGAGTR